MHSPKSLDPGSLPLHSPSVGTSHLGIRPVHHIYRICLQLLGWVAYSVAALTAAVGQNKLMPSNPDCACKVINVSNGYIRDNSSWILGRIVRDFEYWRDCSVTRTLSQLQDEKWARLKRINLAAERPRHASILISIYEPSRTTPTGIAKADVITWTGLFTILVQLAVAAIPLGLFQDWAILLITGFGTALALTTGLLPQWKTEKWACRKKSMTSYILTRGNGAQHAIVILGNGYGLNLEDLASGQSNTEVATNLFTRLALLSIFVLWVLLLITAAGIKDNTWFLLAVGGIGIVQNVFVAGYHRRPESFGLPLDFVEVIGRAKVMDTLLEVERLYENVGSALLPEFFPGSLNESDKTKWEEIKAAHDLARAEAPARDSGSHAGATENRERAQPGSCVGVANDGEPQWMATRTEHMRARKIE